MRRVTYFRHQSIYSSRLSAIAGEELSNSDHDLDFLVAQFKAGEIDRVDFLRLASPIIQKISQDIDSETRRLLNEIDAGQRPSRTKFRL